MKEGFSLPNFCKSLRRIFKHAIMIWNSGNFYTIMASDSLRSLRELVSTLIPFYIPSIFCHETLFGLDGVRLEFRVPSKLDKEIAFREEVSNIRSYLKVVK
jgi:hypothetical protein